MTLSTGKREKLQMVYQSYQRCSKLKGGALARKRTYQAVQAPPKPSGSSKVPEIRANEIIIEQRHVPLEKAGAAVTTDGHQSRQGFRKQSKNGRTSDRFDSLDLSDHTRTSPQSKKINGTGGKGLPIRYDPYTAAVLLRRSIQ